MAGTTLEDASRFLEAIWKQGEVREVRILKHNKYRHTASGYFDSPEKLVRASARYDGKANIFVSLNPVSPALLARANNRILPNAENTTSDQDVVKRTFLCLDIDPVRPSGISSSESELEASQEGMLDVLDALDKEGWPEPITCMSGNGYWLLYSIDLPNDKDSTKLIAELLQNLHSRFSTDVAKIDVSVSNASRICCLMGTMKVKGDSTDERPHRRSQVVYVPETLSEVSEKQMRALLQTAPDERRSGEASGTRAGTSAIALTDLLDGHQRKYREQAPDAAGITWYHLEQCPFHDDGKPFECGVGQELPGGAYAGHCFHPEGVGKGWKEFKKALGLSTVKTDLPTIIANNRHMHELTDNAWSAILRTNNPPTLFSQAGVVTEVSTSAARALLVPVSHTTMKGKVDRCANWCRTTSDGGFVSARPPEDVVKDMLAMGNDLPAIKGIVGVPVFASDGVLTTREGYQPETQLYYVRSGERIPLVSTEPAPKAVERAKDFIESWLGDFPFVDAASKAHAIAATVTLFARELISGPTPLMLIDAPSPATGKGLLADGIGVITSGASPPVMTETWSEEEIRKRITSVLINGPQLVLLDNVKHRIESAAFEGLLTSTMWTDRILGRSETVVLPNRTLWLATGNNLRLGAEIRRRSVYIRLDARVERPDHRTDFLHPDLRGWLQRSRHKVVWAFLLLVSNWNAKGKPAWQGRPLSSFEAWSRVVGGILDAAGIEGFLENRDQVNQEVDEETEEWLTFSQNWWEEHGNSAVKVIDLVGIARESLPSLFASSSYSDRNLKDKTRLGQALARYRDRGFGNLFIRRGGVDAHWGGRFWQLEKTAAMSGVRPLPGSTM